MHVHEPNDTGPLLTLAQAGKLASATIINNVGLANELVKYIPLVVLRMVQGVSDNPVQGYQELNADPRVIYQFGNEANVEHDTNHWVEQMKAADAHNGRKIVIFNDSVGWTSDATWRERVPALVYAKEHSHYVGLHCYGDVTWGGDFYKPMLDPAEPGAFQWFTGRVFHLYDLMVPLTQPDFIATEAGAGGFQLNATADQWLADVKRMNDFSQDYQWFKGFNLWDYTRIGMGFDRDMINGYVHLLM